MTICKIKKGCMCTSSVEVYIICLLCSGRKPMSLFRSQQRETFAVRNAKMMGTGIELRSFHSLIEM